MLRYIPMLPRFYFYPLNILFACLPILHGNGYISNMQIVWYTVYLLIKISSFQRMCKNSIWTLEFTSYLSWLYHTMLVFAGRCSCYVWLYLCSPCFPNSFPRLVVRFGVLPCYSFSYSFVTLLIWWWFPVTFIAPWLKPIKHPSNT